MGTWGTGLFSNDVAPEVKEVYIDCLKVGKTDEEAYAKVLDEFKDYLNDEEDKVDFWLGFASFLFDYGRLDDSTKNISLSLIGVESDLSRWDKKDLENRIAVLDELKVKLNSKMPERKKVSLAKKVTPKVKPNEIYYLKLDDIKYKDKPYYNLYILILIDSWEVYDIRYNLGDEYPLAYFKICKELPSNLSDIDDLPFFSREFSAFEDGITNHEKRSLIMNNGYSKIKDRLKYMGSYDFKRDKDVLGKYVSKRFGFEEVRELHRQSGNLIWTATSDHWDLIERDIVVFFDNCPGAISLID